MSGNKPETTPLPSSGADDGALSEALGRIGVLEKGIKELQKHVETTDAELLRQYNENAKILEEHRLERNFPLNRMEVSRLMEIDPLEPKVDGEARNREEWDKYVKYEVERARELYPHDNRFGEGGGGGWVGGKRKHATRKGGKRKPRRTRRRR